MKGVWGLVVLTLLSCSGREYESVVIRGSDTEVNLVLRLAEEFMDQHSDVSIAVTGGGSGTGIASLINKKTDIANSSRAFRPSEITLARSRGVQVLPIIFALDALCFITHESLALDSLNLQQVRDIFTGKVDNWAAMGLQDLPISLYGRQGNSGTFFYIQNTILQSDYSLDMKQMNGTSQIIESIKNDPAGIGYVGIGYVLNKQGDVIDGVKVLSIEGEQQGAVSPTITQNITSGKYPIVRPLYQYLDGKPEGRLKDFIAYELSPAGQRIIAENGYFPISEAYQQANQKVLSDD
ncbi:MAG: phosphate ABC transporter substrate-binding protein [Bacteroidota bacterium]